MRAKLTENDVLIFLLSIQNLTKVKGSYTQEDIKHLRGYAGFNRAVGALNLVGNLEGGIKKNGKRYLLKHVNIQDQVPRVLKEYRAHADKLNRAAVERNRIKRKAKREALEQMEAESSETQPVDAFETLSDEKTATIYLAMIATQLERIADLLDQNVG